MSHAITSTSRSGCGCGGSSGSAARAGKGSGCSCGGGCGLCQGQQYIRPRFFAGQLLTEEDLDLLEGYVVEKYRLHNRSLFGEGVVCGLLVTCDPCGGAQVTVQPGYALDCCGNDIVLPCPQTVDINALVRRLRIERNGGVDCGDPCAETKAAPKPDAPSGTPPPGPDATSVMMPTTATYSLSATPVSSTTPVPEKPSTPPPLPMAEYCLYVRYCEQLTDPVSPYATDDPCGAQACEPTRVQEGFTFELRCRECDEPAPESLFSRIEECLGNLATAERSSLNIRALMLYAARLAPALQRAEAQKKSALLSEDRLKAADEAVARVATFPEVAGEWTPLHAFDAADRAQTLASVVAAWTAMSPAERGTLPNAAAAKATVTEARKGLVRLERITPKDRLGSLIDNPLDREIVTATVERALPFSDPEEAVKKIPPGDYELMQAGMASTPKLRNVVASSLATIKANLIDRLQAGGPRTDCRLLADVRAIVIPDDDPTDPSGRVHATTAPNAANSLGRAVLRYAVQCVCDAINPVCPPCDDPAVLLACLRVEGCEVVSICNLERTFVLSPVAARYWMPFLRTFGDLLERACCPDDQCDPPSRRRLTPAADVLRSRDAALASYSRVDLEGKSALNLMRGLTGATTLDADGIAAVLPSRLAFSPDTVRRLAVSAAAVVDVASLRRGVPTGDLFAPIFRAGVAPAPAAAGAPAAAPAAAPPPDAIKEVAVMRRDVDKLKKQLADSETRHRDLVARLKTLEKDHG